MPRKVAVVSVVAVALVLAGCGGAPSKPAAQTKASSAVSVAVMPVEKTTITETLTYTGDVKALSNVDVVPKQSGRIVKMAVDVGSRVKQGDVIAELDHTSLDLDLHAAQAQLQEAQAKLATVKAGPRDEHVRQAQLAVDTAQSRYQAMLNGPRPEQVAQARAAVDAAQQKLDALQHPRPETVAQAQLNVDNAKQKLATIQAGAKPEQVAQAQATLTQAQAKLQALKNGMRPENVATLQLAVSQAKNALWSAQANRDGVCGNQSAPKFQCDSANAQVAAAQTAVDQAEANLKAQTAAPTSTDVQQAQAAVDQAQAALDAAKKPYTDQDRAQAQNAVTQAEQQLLLAQQPASAQDVKQAQDAVVQAQQQLAQVSRPYTQEDLRQAKNAIDTAEQALQLAQAPYTKEDVQTAEAGVAQAQAQVDRAAQAVKDATVTAPVSGVVTQKSLSEGALASSSTPIVTISSTDVKVEIPVEETQVTNMKVGQDAVVTGAALGMQQIDAAVSSIAPSGDSKNRTFSVDVSPKQQTEVLLPGMFVKVSINVLQHPDVLAVPKAAVVQRGGKPFVFVVQNDQAKQMPVTVGLSNDTMIEIASGLPSGARVVVQGQQDLTDGDRVTVVAAQQPSAG